MSKVLLRNRMKCNGFVALFHNILSILLLEYLGWMVYSLRPSQITIYYHGLSSLLLACQVIPRENNFIGQAGVNTGSPGINYWSNSAG